MNGLNGFDFGGNNCCLWVLIILLIICLGKSGCLNGIFNSCYCLPVALLLICCFCKKEPSLKPGSYGKACSAKVCTKCQKNLVEKADANSKDKICESCKAEADGGSGDEVAPM